MFSVISAILSGLAPLATAAITAYNKSKDVTITAYQSTAAVVTAQADYMKAVLGHPLSPPSVMCYGLAIWFFKATAVDKVLGPIFGYHWTTDHLTGGTKEIAMIVCSGMFFSGIAAIWKRV